MSALATQLPSLDDVAAATFRRGPIGACAIYGPGDQEDWTAVDTLRRARDWKTARLIVHAQLGLEQSAPNVDKFRYHWRGKCGCWSEDLKSWIDAQS